MTADSNLVKHFRLLVGKIERFIRADVVLLTKRLGWLTTAQFVTILSSFALSIVFANLLSPETYGTYRYLLSVAGLLTISTLSGMNISYTAAVAQDKGGSLSKVIYTKIISSILGTVVGIGVAIYYLLHANQTLGFSIFIVAILAPIVDVFLIYNSILQGKNDFKKLSQYSVISQLLFACFVAAAVYFSKDIYVIIITYFLSLLVCRFSFYRLSLKKYPPEPAHDPETVSRGIHLSVNSAITTIAVNIDKLIIFTYLGAVDLAIYTVATTPVDQARGVFKNLYTILLPKYANTETALIKKDMARKVLILLTISALCMAVYISLVPFVFPLFFPKYSSSIPLTMISALAFLTIPSLFPNTLLQVKANARIYYIYNIITNIGQIVLLLAGAYYYKLIGVVIAKLIGQFLMFITSVIYAKKVQ